MHYGQGIRVDTSTTAHTCSITGRDGVGVDLFGTLKHRIRGTIIARDPTDNVYATACTLDVTDGRTDGQQDGRTDGRNLGTYLYGGTRLFLASDVDCS